MTPERFRQIRNLYEAALEVEPAHRQVFLREACQGENDLEREVRVLLLAHEHATDFMSGPALGVEYQPPGTDTDYGPSIVGRRLGVYRITQELGRGGMGTVYLASRADGVVRQTVAVKIVRADLNDSDLAVRFRREREILAGLDHPAIARLIDAGNTAEGLPYFVMEYVDGLPIDAWCDMHKLDINHRLKLFREVCDGVQYAHQKLIVHRDLKPGNILVTSDGAVKLLDFGIAKLLDAPSDPGREPATRTILHAMTPEYASPEQVRGESVDTRSDVYALGVVLYELLTGDRPFRMQDKTLQETLRVICEEEPALPSTSITERRHPTKTPEAISEVRGVRPAELRRRLEGDLDNIVLKALQKETCRRYGSPDQLSEDLRRHLEGLPVSARENTPSYRALKFIRRHWTGAVALAALAMSLLAGLIAMSWQRQLAVTELRKHQAEDRGSSRREHPGVLPATPLVDTRILTPESLLIAYAALILFGAAGFFTCAKLLRLTGALGGGICFALLAAVEDTVGHRMGWWRYALVDSPRAPTLLYAACALYVATLILASWRISRRFGWRGQIALIAIISAFGPAVDFVNGTLSQTITFGPGLTPLLASCAAWVCNISIAVGVMRLIAGSSRKDSLAQRPAKASA